jgi:hypothetical protein
LPRVARDFSRRVTGGHSLDASPSAIDSSPSASTDLPCPAHGGVKLGVRDEVASRQSGFGFGERIGLARVHKIVFFRCTRQSSGQAAGGVQILKVASGSAKFGVREPIDKSVQSVALRGRHHDSPMFFLMDDTVDVGQVVGSTYTDQD